MVTLTSTHNTSLSQAFPSNVDASFSPYLSTKEPFPVRSLAEPSRNFSPIVTATTTQEKHNHLGRNKEEDDEIGVFRAEKYFNGVIDDETSSRISSISSSTRSYPYKNDGRLNLEQVRAKIQPRTPSVRSESSWNSRSVLLQSGMKNSSRTKSSKLNGKKFLASFGCKCSDKNSVETKNVGEISFNKSPSNASYKSALHHKSRIISPARPGLNLVEPLQIQKPPKVDILSAKPPSGLRQFPVRSALQGQDGDQILCKSPEVFGSPALQRGNKSHSLDRRLTMMSWDRPNAVATTPRAEEIVFNANSSANHHDSGSDASSDLFEIDSLTGKTNPFMVRTSDDQTSGCVTPTTGYAPSEASIQWSVVTASAADYSVMSDCEETVTRPASKMVLAPAQTRMSKEILPRRRSSTLLGCKSQKAVNVAGDAYRASTPRPSYEPNMRFRSDSPARFQAEIAKLTDFNTRVGQHSLAQIPRLASP
ncbi:hypothetical protein L484_003197 [Morus notabilis]|uniref:Protein PHYTOCHROME KINASE SUBSTRATE 1 n=2 Tax=Morus notabilis TaxID=981085 RepID=W9QJ73_9ROSA|nr:hypothetical protein L484_003197 [Morus notabilis]